LAKASAEELSAIFSRYSGERYAKLIAKRIVESRELTPLTSTFELAKLVERAVLSRTSRKIVLKTHPATKVFQALRIAVNSELENIEHFLKQAYQVLKPGARLVCISFHSLEDRLVKNFFKDFCLQNPTSKIVTNKAIVPSEQQILANPSCRSAKLRAFEK
jgi:16S rRNA (cytosine1402-N4)-methyltransferase